MREYGLEKAIRDEFEEWAGGWGHNVERNQDGDYVLKCTQGMWDAWQAQQSEINQLKAEIENLRDRIRSDD